MRSDISLYENSRFIGFVTPETVEEYFDEYYSSAMEAAKKESWDMVILYAILEYDVPFQTFYSADFMTIPIPYGVYTELVSKISSECRLFFIRGRKEFYDE